MEFYESFLDEEEKWFREQHPKESLSKEAFRDIVRREYHTGFEEGQRYVYAVRNGGF